jgi:putative membrane protein
MKEILMPWIYAVPTGLFFWKIMFLTLLYATFVVWFDPVHISKDKFVEIDGIMTTSAVIGVLFAFRTTTAYDRWWEGRKLWGQLVNEIRNLALKSTNYLDGDQSKREQLELLLIAFPHALRDHLRKLPPSKQVQAVLSADDRSAHIPLRIAQLTYELVNNWAATGKDKFDLLLLDPHMRAFMDVCGACERIQKTPIARPYKEMIWVSLVSYNLVLPWLLEPIIGIWTIPAVFMGSYYVFTLELLAEELEEPFGNNPHDLPLSSICQTIEDSVRQTFAQQAEPKMLEPANLQPSAQN